MDEDEVAALNSAPGRIVYPFHARDPHVVPGPHQAENLCVFRVRIDGRAPGESDGTNTVCTSLFA